MKFQNTNDNDDDKNNANDNDRSNGNDDDDDDNNNNNAINNDTSDGNSIKIIIVIKTLIFEMMLKGTRIISVMKERILSIYFSIHLKNIMTGRSY
jgi:hypothetical protein